jgi:Secretion system C-terminal sorting domain
MMRIKIIMTGFLIGIMSITLSAQTPYIVDECFFSASAQTGFASGFDLTNNNADLMEWTGSEWYGSWSNCFLTQAPPSNRVGCRAVFIGSGIWWTAPGESFGMRLSDPLIAGNSYTFYFTYVSDGYGSNGAFNPILSSGNAGTLGNDIYITNLPPAGYDWVKNGVTFTASAAQEGHHWLFLSTNVDISSGIISSFCEGCSDIVAGIGTMDKNSIVTLFPNPASDALTLEININGIRELGLEVFSSNGKILYAEKETNISESIRKTLDISAFADGCYFIRIITDGRTEVQSFLKSGK